MEARNELKHIHSHIHDLQRLGEAKHAGLIVLNAGLIIGLLTCYSTIHNFVYKPIILVGSISFGISLFLSIVSQFPVTSKRFYNKRDISNPNIYFFGDLVHLDEAQFVKIYHDMDANFLPTKFHTDLINQILVNARIARSKFEIFKYASYLTGFGAGIIGFATIIRILFNI
jgi:hypothetical protein